MLFTQHLKAVKPNIKRLFGGFYLTSIIAHFICLVLAESLAVYPLISESIWLYL